MNHLRRSFLFRTLGVLGLLVGALACGSGSTTNPDATVPRATASHAVAAGVDEGRSVDIQCSKATLSVEVQPDVPMQPLFPQAGDDISLESLQCDFDVFSWNSFLALNHSPRGEFGNVEGDNPTLWQDWPESNEVFLADGAAPPPWPPGQPPPPPPPGSIPEECQGPLDKHPGVRLMRQVGKRPNVAEATDQPFLSGPLIDVHGRYSRFEITVNQPMYQYIVDHELYSRSGQSAFAAGGGLVEFPCGCNAPSTDSAAGGATCPPEGSEGAVMVKAAWKVLDPQLDGHLDGRIHRSKILVYTPANGDEPATCEAQTMGLVGLHIGHKTQESPQWVWSTFEQVDNVPTQQEGTDRPAYNYYQADCPPEDPCNRVNQPPPQPWDPHLQPVTTNAGKSQVERVIPIDAATRALNESVQGILDGTVWQGYELVSTQWPTAASGANSQRPNAENGWCTGLNPTDKSGNPAPTFLANTTLETYVQGRQVGDSSCINCHLNATMAEGQASFSDFTYLLERAQ